MKPTDKPKKPGFIFMGWQGDIEKKRLVSVKLMGKPVAVFPDGEGGFFAREMACKHQAADLTGGTFKGATVTCPRHGWQYDLKSGTCINRDSPPLREHEVAVEEGAVFVALFPKS